jgi:steroid 5-alpha reductase family enzyme
LSALLDDVTTRTAHLWPFGAAQGLLFATLVVTILAFSALWALSLAKRDCGVVDLYWAFGFAVIGWIEFAAVPARGWPATLLILMVTSWALRLGVHLVRRHVRATGEDPRYRAMREKGGPAWPMRSFWWVFMLQAVVMWLVATPLHAAFTTSLEPQFPVLIALGALLFAVGFVIESLADAAIARFRDDPGNRGALLTKGLFAWSRHPNYFGEATLWWGIGLVALGISAQWAALVGPLLLTFLLVKVSGVPILGEYLSARPGYAEWAARTSAFIPLPPKSPPLDPHGAAAVDARITARSDP